ncbi:unnamed protein product [Paramecium primaurelia]|uniref:Uncharacterized protein n=1 Tax=Paramecium primaurelia TaxID=5886 RepID=A0A8S1PJM6_PARPR|nr:unnamed protein product [Paramecium primaurelia]
MNEKNLNYWIGECKGNKIQEIEKKKILLLPLFLDIFNIQLDQVEQRMKVLTFNKNNSKIQKYDQKQFLHRFSKILNFKKE